MSAYPGSLADREQRKCPNVAAHNMPDFGYCGPDDDWLAANEQRRCDGCGYYVIATPASEEGDRP